MLDNLIDEWLNGYSENTKQTYSRYIKEFMNKSNLDDVQDVSQKHIDKYLEEKSLKSQPIIAHTLKSFFKFVYAKGYLKINVGEAINIKRFEKEERPYLELNDFKELLQQIKDEEDKKMIEMIYYGELKATEVAKILGISRNTVWSRIKKYHPIATPEMIKNSLNHHKRYLAELYFKNQVHYG